MCIRDSYLDLYIIHRYDADTPVEETMEALDSLVRAGKVRALGASAMYGYQFFNMQLAAREDVYKRQLIFRSERPGRFSLPSMADRTSDVYKRQSYWFSLYISMVHNIPSTTGRMIHGV